MDISFVSFAALIYRLGNPPKSDGSKSPSNPSKIFSAWLQHLPKPLPPHTGKQLFRLLFLHEGSRRRYGLKETKLAVELERILGVRGLTRWDSVSCDRGGEGGTGCLGKEVELLLRDRIPSGSKSSLTLAAVDSLLDTLAAHSTFSQLSLPPANAPTTSEILTKLYRDSDLSPYALCVLTQIILRDLRPLLNPLPQLRIRNPTAMLRIKSTAGPGELTLYAAIRCWDDRMFELYRGGKGSLDWCADMAEAMGGEAMSSLIPDGPVVGVNVPIPKCRKGRSVEDALNVFLGTASTPPARMLWAETKYGYRMQIHVEVADHGPPRITIFSKSKRNSTLDRLNTHAILIAALGLPSDGRLLQHPALVSRSHYASSGHRRVQRSIILEAEVVPYNEGQREGMRGPGIEEFWWLGAAGVTAERDASGLPAERFGADRHRHLCLVFFDVLHLDGESLIQQPYFRRRQILEDVIRVVPGFSVLAERTSVPLTMNRGAALAALRDAFQKSSDRREEGLVLKAAESTYTDMQYQWVKLKKDYIPNLGDCIDLVVLGAGWDFDRARELRVDTSVFTTFYIGSLTNSERVKSRKEAPHFEILFRASYGMTRDQLEVYNEYIRHGRWRSKAYDRDDPFKKRLLGLSWTYKMPRGMIPPSIFFDVPLCGEIMGAGFQRLPESSLYELRWPRLQKIFEASERPWTQALSAKDLIITAHQSLGYLTTISSPEQDSVRAAWRSSSTACLDVPELPTPSPIKRVQSAPDLFEIGKLSPPTPGSSGIRRPLGVSRVLENILVGREVEEEETPPMFARTPVTSPVGKRLGSPLAPLEKRRRVEPITPTRTKPKNGLRTPVTSPIQMHSKTATTSMSNTTPSPSRPRVSHPSTTITFDSPPRMLNFAPLRSSASVPITLKRRICKALSLRSRIRLAVKSAKP